MSVEPTEPKVTRAAKTGTLAGAAKAAPRTKKASATSGATSGGITPINPAVASVSAFFPCYNDEHTIGEMVGKVEKALEESGVDYEILVVNDGSSDNSANVLDALQAEHPKLRVITHNKNRGYGGALQSGIENSIKDWVFYTDGDGQYDPSEITKLIQLASADVDVVQGYKIGRSDSLMRKIVGRTYHHGVAILFNLEVEDVDCDFRLMRRTKLREFRLVNTSGAITLELCRKLQETGARWVQTGVHHYDREFGASQFFTVRRVSKTLWDLARMWVKLIPGEALARRRARRAAAQSR
ncbi:MAG: glycosyltransferase family 2 protein [Acidimicrobiia bacterium]